MLLFTDNIQIYSYYEILLRMKEITKQQVSTAIDNLLKRSREYEKEIAHLDILIGRLMRENIIPEVRACLQKDLGQDYDLYGPRCGFEYGWWSEGDPIWFTIGLFPTYRGNELGSPHGNTFNEHMPKIEESAARVIKSLEERYSIEGIRITIHTETYKHPLQS